MQYVPMKRTSVLGRRQNNNWHKRPPDWKRIGSERERAEREKERAERLEAELLALREMY